MLHQEPADEPGSPVVEVQVQLQVYNKYEKNPSSQSWASPGEGEGKRGFLAELAIPVPSPFQV